MTIVAPAWKILEVIEMVVAKKKESKTNATSEPDYDEPMPESRTSNPTGDEILKVMLNTPPSPRKGDGS